MAKLFGFPTTNSGINPPTPGTVFSPQFQKRIQEMGWKPFPEAPKTRIEFSPQQKKKIPDFGDYGNKKINRQSIGTQPPGANIYRGTGSVPAMPGIITKKVVSTSMQFDNLNQPPVTQTPIFNQNLPVAQSNMLPILLLAALTFFLIK